jgi:hypothetical protein
MLRSVLHRGTLVIAALLLAGCAQTFDATQLGVPATMAAPAGQAVTGPSFRVTSHSVFGFWGLLSLRKPSLERALASQLIGGKGVANVKIKVRSRWSDVLFTVLTAGLLVPRSVTFEGTITNAAPAAP